MNHSLLPTSPRPAAKSPALPALPSLQQVISGGQTGADRAALDWALRHRIPHGGWCPRGRVAADGTLPTYYQLRETESPGYYQRTKRNVDEADATVIFVRGTAPTGGTLLTHHLALKYGKPHLLLYLDKDSVATLAQQMQAWISSHQFCVLNIAGPSEAGTPGTYAKVLGLLEHCSQLTPPQTVTATSVTSADAIDWDALYAQRTAWCRTRYALMVLDLQQG